MKHNKNLIESINSHILKHNIRKSQQMSKIFIIPEVLILIS